MARTLKPLTRAVLHRLPAGCASCAFWETDDPAKMACGSVCDEERLQDWQSRVTSEWGECGRVAIEDDEVLGFIKYAPSGYFPRASTLAAAPEDPNVPLIACIHIDPTARHRGLGSVLLRACLRDLVLKGEKRVEAFALAARPVSLDDVPMLGIDFLLRNGFTVSRPDPYYPLLRLDLRSLAVWADNFESVLEALRFPVRVPKRQPASWMKGD